jgi:CRP/FNR family transcriptional regulator, cyclic AMP receptor protein
MKSTLPSSSSKDKVGAGRSIVNRNERTFKRGSLMCIEGESSAEMFILRTGKVRVLKQEGEKAIELAVLGAGAVLGELALLDHQPRGATAQVVEDCTATIIDEATLNATLAAVPTWLANIIQVVVKRLRETMARTSKDVVEKSVGGVIKVLLLLFEKESPGQDGERRLSLKSAKEAIHATIGIGDMEAENVFLHLILKNMLLIRKNDGGEEYLLLTNPSVMLMYMNFLRSKQRGAKLPGEDFNPETLNVIRYIVQTGRKSGRRVKENILRVGVQQVELEMARESTETKKVFIAPETLDALEGAKAVVIERPDSQASKTSHARDVIMYNEESLGRMEILQQWLPTFREEIKF